MTISATEPDANGIPGSWVQSGKTFDVCIATALSEVAQLLRKSGKTAEAKSLAETAETGVIRTAILAEIVSHE